MPIYAYRCESCGFAKDVLRKMSDPLLTDCPQCGKSTFRKQVTAAGFQLKGSGWYVTDFREGGSNTAAKPATGAAPADAKGATGEGGAGAADAGAAKNAGDGGAKGGSGDGGGTSSAPAAVPAAAKPAATPSSSSGGAGSSGA